MNTQPNELHPERLDDKDRAAIASLVANHFPNREAELIERSARNKPASGPGIGGVPLIKLSGKLPAGSWDYEFGWSPHHGAMRSEFTLWGQEEKPGDGSGQIDLQIHANDHDAARRAAGAACPEFAAAWTAREEEQADVG